MQRPIASRLRQFAIAYHSDLMLLGITAVWGSTFVVVKGAVEQMPPFSFMAWRFALAALVMSPALVLRRRRLDRATVLAGLVLGLMLYAMYAFQTFGLARTTASRAGFVTGLFVAFTPAIEIVWFRRVPSRATLLGVIVAVMGLGLLTVTDRLTIGLGDLLVLGAAFFVAVHIIALSRYSPRHDVLLLVAIQLAVAAVLHATSAAVFEKPALPPNTGVVGAILLTGLLASALAFFVQTYAQQTVGPTRTAVVLTAEPVFAGIFGYVFRGEVFLPRGWAGAGMILAAMFLVEVLPALRHRALEPALGREES